MIRKKTRPVSVCTGKRTHIKNEAKKLFKESFLKPDVKIEQHEEESKKYKIIPLHKNIHIVSSAEVRARKRKREEGKIEAATINSQRDYRMQEEIIEAFNMENVTVKPDFDRLDELEPYQSIANNPSMVFKSASCENYQEKTPKKRISRIKEPIDVPERNVVERTNEYR